MAVSGCTGRGFISLYAEKTAKAARVPITVQAQQSGRFIYPDFTMYL